MRRAVRGSKSLVLQSGENLKVLAVSRLEEPERKELREVRRADTSNRIPARLRREALRAAAWVRSVSDIVECLLERARVDLQRSVSKDV